MDYLKGVDFTDRNAKNNIITSINASKDISSIYDDCYNEKLKDFEDEIEVKININIKNYKIL